tara:strand:- start:134 stop:442 length:309 start_codon:yes stop_codon:yes gene_type:complete
MPNKYQIDRQTKRPDGNESHIERVERIKKRVAWNIELDEDDFNFFEKKKAFFKELEDAKRFTKSAPVVSNYGSKPPEVKTGKRGGKYTLDKTKDGRPYRRYF